MRENTKDQPNFDVDRIAEVGFEARWNAHRKLNSGRPIGFSVLLSAFSSPRAPPDLLVLTTSVRLSIAQLLNSILLRRVPLIVKLFSRLFNLPTWKANMPRKSDVHRLTPCRVARLLMRMDSSGRGSFRRRVWGRHSLQH